tara:strand:+ start:302 stop:970 length:669 start_codon:yes stop_codon:yes gene_type:complete
MIVKNPFNQLAIIFLRFYQLAISPFLGVNCRFYPTCSQYSIESFREFGFFKGTYLTFKRLVRCHPFGGSGYDPVKNSNELKILKIPLKKIRLHRLKELYDKLPQKLSKYDDDDSSKTLHFGLFYENELVSGLTIIEKKIDQLDEKSAQIRGMFTVSEFCRRGFGSLLLNHLVMELKKRRFKIMWCNSRIVAINFYKKFGFTEVGKLFFVEHIGLHKKLLIRI